MRVHLSNLGCKLNQAEIEALGRSFLARGHRVVSSLADADVHVVNTCTVTHVADRSSRKLARRAGRLENGVRTVLTGCYATAAPDDAAALAGVDLVVDNTVKHRLAEEVESAFPELSAPAPRSASPYGESAFAAGRSRAAVKIEDGCNMRCSFCIIPFTRGSQTSRDPDEIAAEVGELVASGLREVVLTGVQISSYRWGRLRLVDLVHSLLPVVRPARLRLTSIAPWAFDDRLLDLLASGDICPHVHLSLQAGCDRTLQRMKRPYSVADFERLAAAIRAAQPQAAITTDVIVGFPGERDADFEASLSAIERIGFAKTHVFPYSTRQGTAAAYLDDPIDPSLKGQRMEAMLEVAAISERAFQRRNLGGNLEVLWEHGGKRSVSGTTGNYLKIRGHPTERRRAGSLRHETLRRGDDGELWAA